MIEQLQLFEPGSEYNKLSGESFQPVSRGLLKHFYLISGDGIKLYLFFLLKVNPFGDRKGKCRGYVCDWCDILNWNRNKFYKNLKKLDPYLTVKYSNSRHHQIEVTIRNYKGIKDFYSIQNDDGKATVTHGYRINNETVKQQYGNSKATVSQFFPNKINDLQNRKNIKNTRLEDTSICANEKKTKLLNEWYKEYPNKKGRAVIERKWFKLKLEDCERIRTLILSALLWQKKSDQWIKDNGQYVPMASTYFNQRRWEDEPEQGTTSRKTGRYI